MLKMIILAASILLGGPTVSSPTTPEALHTPSLAASDVANVTAHVSNAGWVVDRANHICGISDPKKMSKPATIDFSTVLASTKEMKEMKKKGIDPDSIEGRTLRNRAMKSLTKACQQARQANGHCGIWKSVRHSDGRSVSDLTYDVISRL